MSYELSRSQPVRAVLIRVKLRSSVKDFYHLQNSTIKPTGSHRGKKEAAATIQREISADTTQRQKTYNGKMSSVNIQQDFYQLALTKASIVRRRYIVCLISDALRFHLRNNRSSRLLLLGKVQQVRVGIKDFLYLMSGLSDGVTFSRSTFKPRNDQ